MKKMKKFFALLIAVTMVMSMGITAFAAATADSGKGGNASITITLPTDNSGKDEEITYKVYKVFNATNDGQSNAISYQIDSANGDLTAAMTEAGFSVDTAGNVTGPSGTELSADAITAIAAYAKDSIGTFTAKPSDGTLQITGLEYGYYYITTTTGSVVTVDSTNPNAAVQDKNTIPGPPDKKITGVDTGSFDEAGQNAIAQVGTKVTFTATIKKVKGATNYVFHDTMTAGLLYNNDVAVTPASLTYDDTVASGDTITLTFDNDKLATGGLEIDIKSRTVTVDGEDVKLTPIEFHILRFLMENMNTVFSTSQIYEAVWQDEYLYDDNTITVHISHLRSKIDDDEKNHIETLIGIGYRFT